MGKAVSVNLGVVHAYKNSWLEVAIVIHQRRNLVQLEIFIFIPL